MKTCKDYSGECCDSCHDDADNGWHDLPEIYKDGKVFARVCCSHTEQAEEDANKH